MPQINLEQGSEAGGIIAGATGGSAITPAGLPTGLTVNGPARTWAWDGSGDAGTGTFTLTEVLPAALNSPRETVIDYTISVSGVPIFPVAVNPALPIPTMAMTSGQEDYPLTLEITGLVEAQEGDVLWLLQTDDDAGTVNPVYYYHVITSADVEATPPVEITFPGLADRILGTHRFWLYIARGSERGPASNQITHGPDDVAPVLTSGSGTPTGSTTATLTVTTNEGNGTLYTVVTAANTAPSKAQVKAGQNASGAAAAFADSQAITTVGIKTFTATGLTAVTEYFVWFMHEDALGNQSEVFDGNSFTTEAVSVPALVGGFDPAAVDRGATFTSHTFTAQPIGTPSSTRVVVVCVSHNNNDAAATVTFAPDTGGTITATLVKSELSAQIYAAAVPLGTSIDITIAPTSGIRRAMIQGYVFTGISATAKWTGGAAFGSTDPRTVTPTIGTDEIALGFLVAEGGTKSITVSAGTAGYQTQGGTDIVRTMRAAHRSTAGNLTWTGHAASASTVVAVFGS